MIKALYVHVPFCNSICAYCDFVRVKYHDGLADQWLVALASEIQTKAINRALETIYLGGGTPTSLSNLQLETLLELLKPYTEHILEYTIEMNPETVSEEKLLCLKHYGVNRISLGVQSFNDDLLKLMNRNHHKEQIEQALHLFQKVGFLNYSIDLMYSLPTQTMNQWVACLNEAISLNIPHISLYALTIEEHSEFKRKGLGTLDEDCEALMYETAIDLLSKAGYIHYEISNFALPGFESVHNQVYWHYEDFYGLGLGSSGKENHCRYDNTHNFIEYQKGNIIENQISLSLEDEMFEMLMMGLRLKKGISMQRFLEYFNKDIHDVYGDKINKLIQAELICEQGDALVCTERGFRLLNSVLVELM